MKTINRKVVFSSLLTVIFLLSSAILFSQSIFALEEIAQEEEEEEERINRTSLRLSPLVSSEEDLSFILGILVGQYGVNSKNLAKYDLYEDGRISVLDALVCCREQLSVPFNNDTYIDWGGI